MLLGGAVKAPSLVWGHFPTRFSFLLEQPPHHKYSRYCGLSTQQLSLASFSFAYLSPKRGHPAFLVVRRGYMTQFWPMKYMGDSPGGLLGKISSPSKSLKEKAFASYSLRHSAFRCGCLQGGLELRQPPCNLRQHASGRKPTVPIIYCYVANHPPNSAS